MRKNLSSLQLFRGIAAVLVLLYHNSIILEPILGIQLAWGIFDPFGAHGVDFFFVLSGFIILYAHYKDIGSTRLLPYIKKRFIRIYPLYWSIIIPLIPLIFLFPTLGSQDNERNLFIILKSILLIPDYSPPLLGVAWTLTHEVFFYTIFGLTLILLRPTYSIPILLGWTLTTTLNFAGIVHFDHSLYMNFIFNKYNLEFIFGMISAYLFLKIKPTLAWLLLFIGIIGFLFAGINEQLKISPLDNIVSYGLSAALLIMGAARLEMGIITMRIPQIFVYVGGASYSIYLTHYPVIIVLGRIVTKVSIHESILMYTSALIALIVGCLFHSMIEKPLITLIRGKQFSQKGKLHNEIHSA